MNKAASTGHGDALPVERWQTRVMSAPSLDTTVYLDRLDRVRAAMGEHDVDAVMLSVGHDLPYLTGYTSMPLERLTLLIVPREGDPSLLIPGLEAARVTAQPGVFQLLPWTETDDPTAIASTLVAGAHRIAVGDQMWARFLVEMLPHLSGVEFTRAVDVVGALRRTKDQAEIDALAAAGAAVDLIAGELQRGEIPLVGRTEADVSAHLGRHSDVRRIGRERHKRLHRHAFDDFECFVWHIVTGGNRIVRNTIRGSGHLWPVVHLIAKLDPVQPLLRTGPGPARHHQSQRCAVHRM